MNLDKKLLNIDKSKIYNLLKVITIVLVVLAHVTRMYTEVGVFSPYRKSECLSYLTKVIYKFHMPLFIMISGCVYSFCLEHGKYNNVKKFIINKFRRLIIPYLFWGIFYVAPIMIVLGLTELSYSQYCFHNIILCYDSRHLWYIVTLFFIFMLAIVMNRYIKNSIIILVTSIGLHILCRLVVVHILVNYILHYQLYFWIGYCLNIYFDQVLCIWNKVKKLTLPILFILVFMSQYDKNILTNDFLAGIGCFVVFSLVIYIEMYIHSFAECKLYKVIEKNGFGIYLLHPMLIYIIFYFGKDMDINPFIFTILTTVSVFIISILFTYIIRILKLKFIIGE